MKIRAFQGLRPAPAVVEKVASPPYDVVSGQEVRAIVTDNPLSMLRVVRAEGDLEAGAHPYSDRVYKRAVENFRKMQSKGHLIRETEPSLYLYHLQTGQHRQRGVAALCHLEDYENGLIKLHEGTRKEKEDDRTRLTSDLSANPGPVFLTYRDDATIDSLVEEISQKEPLYDFTVSGGVRHTLWKIPEGETLVEAFRQAPCFYVADGHHRSASAARVARERRSTNPNPTGNEDYNWFLCVLFPASQLRILAYNRVISDLNGLNSSEFLEKVRAALPGPVAEDASPTPENPGEASMYLDGRWHGLKLTAAPGSGPVERLDISVLQEKVFRPILGIENQKTSDRIEFVGGIRGPDELKKRVDSGWGTVAFSLYPVTIELLLEIADSGRNMPPKSTWFEPKLRSGLFIHTFEPQAGPRHGHGS